MAYWIELDSKARLATAARPRGGDWLETEMAQLRRERADILVSLLTDDEVIELGLSQEADECKIAGIDFRNFPIPDRDVPASTEDFRKFIAELHAELRGGKSIVAHCRAGIGRSSLLIASLLKLEGMTAAEAFRRISVARGLPVPDTQRQVKWVEQLIL